MRRFLLAIFLFSCLLGSVSAVEAGGQVQVYNLFARTFYPLDVFYIQGEKPGPTIMIQGGIQGDESAGVLTADLLRQAKVKKGNLIVVPRANVPALNQDTRKIHVDLNRRFDRQYDRFYEDILARAIKFFVARSDGLIHLHEGSGFYCPEYVDQSRNPQRFGQSVIIDCAAYSGVPDLGRMARRAIDRVNAGVSPPQYVFTLFNTDTFAKSTPHAEQRKSLTFHTVSKLRKPALAVEVSKQIRDMSWKVEHQIIMVREILNNMGVNIELPDNIDVQVDEWFDRPLPVAVNGQSLEGLDRITLHRMSTLRAELNQGTDKAWSVSPSNMPQINLLTSEIIPQTGFKCLQVRVDGRLVREIPVHWKGSGPKEAGADPLLVYSLNGRIGFCMPGTEIEARVGDSFLLLGLWGEQGGEVLNIKGYVSNHVHNDGQDKHSRLVLLQERFMRRYIQVKEQGFKARIVRETPSKKSVQWHLRVLPPESPDVFCRKNNLWFELGAEKETVVHVGNYMLTTGNDRQALFVTQDRIGPDSEPVLSLGYDQVEEFEVVDSRTFFPLSSMSLRGPDSIREPHADRLEFPYRISDKR